MARPFPFNADIRQPFTIKLEPREDGGLRVSSDDMLGLILSNGDQRAVLRDLAEAIPALARHNHSKQLT